MSNFTARYLFPQNMEPQIYSTYILLGTMTIMSVLGFNNRDFMEKYLFSPYEVKHEKEYYRFITHAFLHGDFAHMLFNGDTLFFFGKPFELYLYSFYGPLPGEIIFWVFVLIAMFASSSISYLRHKDNPNYRSLGLSGVTSAILFAMIMLAPNMKIALILPLLVALALPAQAQNATPAKKPNILFIVSDDTGFGDLFVVRNAGTMSTTAAIAWR